MNAYQMPIQSDLVNPFTLVSLCSWPDGEANGLMKQVEKGQGMVDVGGKLQSNNRSYMCK